MVEISLDSCRCILHHKNSCPTLLSILYQLLICAFVGLMLNPQTQTPPLLLLLLLMMMMMMKSYWVVVWCTGIA